MKTTFIKKFICIPLVLALLLCGCNTVQNGEENTTESTTAQASVMPEIKKEVKASRWYEEFTDTLIPRDDYGELVIFTGGYCHDESNGYLSEELFGLMTLDGKIVVDPVFNRYRTYELDDKKYYNMKITENELYEGGEYKCTSLLVASDGSWAVTLDGDIDHITPERIFTSKYDEYFKCYDYDGNIVFEGGENLSYAWNYGTSSHTKLMGAYDWDEERTPLLVFDMDGNIVFDEFDFFVSFESGKSVVKVTETQLYGIITDSGEWLLEPVYSDIDSVAEDKYFVAVRDNADVEVYDNSLNLLHSFTTFDYDGQTRYYEAIGDRLLYYCGHIDAKDDYYRDMYTDEIITCKENGLPATRYSEEDGTFSLTDENGTDWYFDVDGNVTDKIENPKGADTDADHNEESDSAVNSHEYEDYETEYLDYKGFPNLAIINHIRLVEWPVIKGISKLINYKTGEVFLENCEDIEISEYGGKQFMTVVYTDYIYIYDEDFNLIMGTENVLYD
ncbi:MAG: WG repeat-containing protein [Clostridia bacterium]|nr:WG repeat-containing protein [Clostridia bacterium]